MSQYPAGSPRDFLIVWVIAVLFAAVPLLIFQIHRARTLTKDGQTVLLLSFAVAILLSTAFLIRFPKVLHQLAKDWEAADAWVFLAVPALVIEFLLLLAVVRVPEQWGKGERIGQHQPRR